MWKKAAVPVSAVVFVAGLVMIIVSVVGGGSEGTASSPVSLGDRPLTTSAGDVSTTDAGGFTDSTNLPGRVKSPGPTTAAPSSSGQQVSAIPSTSASLGGGTASPTSFAPPSGSPTTFAYSATPGPMSPGLPGSGLPSRDSITPSTTPPVVVGTLVSYTCSSFQQCAQKLYNDWIVEMHCFEAGAFSVGYATQSVVDTMRAFCGRSQGNWNPTLIQGANRYQLVGVSDRTTTPKTIVFSMIPGQTDFIVRSVQIQ